MKQKRNFDCGFIGDEFCVARDSEHHYLIKFTLYYGRWVFGCKRGRIKIRCSSIHWPKLSMTMGYYEEPVELKMKIKERYLKLLINEVK